MSKKIRKSRRKEIKAAVLNVLKSCDKITLPLDIEYIIENMKNVCLIPYSKIMKKHNLSYEEMLKFAGSSDGFTVYYYQKNSYLVVYNDAENLMRTKRYRFTLAHELGHISLKHHLKTEKIKIFRGTLSEKEYSILEAEADYFASLILVPHIVLSHFKHTVNTPTKIAKICDISGTASSIRFTEYNKWLKNQSIPSKYDEQMLYLFQNYMYKYTCNQCGNLMVFHNLKYCFYCGSTDLKWIGDGKMIYNKFTYIECPKCKNEEINENDNFCIICGNNLQNYCINEYCDNYTSKISLPKSARYCPHCGSETTFLIDGFLQEWNYNEFANDDDVPPFNDVIENDIIEDDDLPF